MKKSILVFCMFIFSLAAPFAQEAGKFAPAAEVMPSIKLKDINGKDVDLKELTNKGKTTIVSFWATWCGPCKKELDNINLHIDEWKKKYGVEVIAISIDDSRNVMKVKPFVNGKKWDFTVLTDVNQDTKRVLNFENVPYTLLVDKTGNIVYKHNSYVEGDEEILEQKIAALPK